MIFTIGQKELSFIGLEEKPVVEPGMFKVSIGDLSSELEVYDR